MKGRTFYTIFLLFLEIGLVTKTSLRAVDNPSRICLIFGDFNRVYIVQSARPSTTFWMTDMDRKHHNARIWRFSAGRDVNSSLKGKQSVVNAEIYQHESCPLCHFLEEVCHWIIKARIGWISVSDYGNVKSVNYCTVKVLVSWILFPSRMYMYDGDSKLIEDIISKMKCLSSHIHVVSFTPEVLKLEYPITVGVNEPYIEPNIQCWRHR